MIVTAVAEQIFLTRSGNARQSEHEGRMMTIISNWYFLTWRAGP